MNHHYKDITDRLGDPKWWDEEAVPRYCEFGPDEGANIYARQICLMEILCQNCNRPFRVAMSANGFTDARDALERAVKDGSLHYGDPPNIDCCGAGPTMNSVPRRVLEFWDRRHPAVRRPDLEVEIACEWYEGETPDGDSLDSGPVRAGEVNTTQEEGESHAAD